MSYDSITMTDDAYNFFLSYSSESLVCSYMLNSWFTTKDVANYLDFKNGRITYLPKGKEHLTRRDGTWMPRNRVIGRPAKVIRKFLNADARKALRDRDYERFNNLCIAEETIGDALFSIVAGEDITKWYHEQHHARYTGSLGVSCMRYDECQSYFDLYENNSACRMLILVRDEKLIGRALLWETEHGTLMDRIYGTDGTIAAFQHFAQANGYWRRKYNSYQHPTRFVRDGEERSLLVTLTLDNLARFGYYPYMDTFKYLDVDRKFLSNNARKRWTYRLDGTSGVDHTYYEYRD